MSSARAPVDARAGVETSKDDAHVSAVVRTDDDDDGFRDDAVTPAVTQARAAHHGRALRTASANGRTWTTGRKRRRSELGPLGTMGDLKTTPMQTPRVESDDVGLGGFNIAKRRSMSACKSVDVAGGSAGGAIGRERRRRTRRDSSSARASGGKRGIVDDDDGDGNETPGFEEDTPRSEWGGMSPGEYGGSQYVISAAREFSQCDSDEDRTARARAEKIRDDECKRDAAAARVQAEKDRQLKLYPIFRTGQKKVHLVRHGQSTWNAANSGPGSWDEPKMFDAALTELGRKQAKALGMALSKMPKNALWITSPLTRAIETCIIGRKAALEAKAAELNKAQRGGANVADDASPDENVDDLNTPLSTSSKKAFNPEREFEEWTSRLMIREELTEKLSCSGDVGRPRRCLEAEFPELELALSRIPEDRWWWEGCEHRPNDAQSEQFKSLEPQTNFKRRVARFRDWLLKRPEETFVVFGHSTFFKEFSKSERSMKNCEIHEMRL